MRVLGVDPGLVRTGWAVLTVEGDAHRLLDAGVIEPDSKVDLGARLDQGFTAITEVVERHSPQIVGLEQLFSAPGHPSSSLLMAHMRGVLCLAFERAGVPVRHYTATTVKQRLTGNGHASKDQVRRMVFELCQMPPRRVRLDLTDAIALAITVLSSERNALPAGEADPAYLDLVSPSKQRDRRASWAALLAEQGHAISGPGSGHR